MEQPVLRLGLVGFSNADTQSIVLAMAQIFRFSEGRPRWELTDFEQADAWCIRGGSVQRLPGNQVLVNTLIPRLPTITLDPKEIARPIAFTAPLPAGLEASELVNLTDPNLLRVSLQRFEAWLRPLRAQFSLGAQLVVREQELSQGVYHVLDTQSKLLAVINLISWRVAMMPIAQPLDFEDASWVQRPAMAADVPPGFLTISVVQLMWIYAVRTEQDVLPARYRKQKVYLRRLPNLPAGWVRDEHLVVLRALSAAPAKFKDLQDTTALSDESLARALAALYFSGAITTNAASAMQIERKPSPVGGQSSLPPVSLAFALPETHYDMRNHPYPQSPLDITAPAPLFTPPR